MMVVVILVGLAGLLSIPAYLVHFAVTTRRDALEPVAQARAGRWARRACGVSVQDRRAT
jgi:hypothetical protein